MERRTLEELINKEEPGWKLVEEWIGEGTNHIEFLPAQDPARSEALVATQVTTRSPMGAIIYESGGILVDHGWLRILGSGHQRLNRSLPGWNNAVGNDLSFGPPPFLLIADDVVGGFFALGGADFPSPGEVFYNPPDSIEWEETGYGYSDFVYWCFCGDLEKYYENCRWPDWQTEIAELTGEQGISIYPFLFAEGPPVADRARGVVPISELYELHINELPRQLRGVRTSPDD